MTLSFRTVRYAVYIALTIAIVWLGLASMAMAASHETGTLLDFKPIVTDLIAAVFVVLSSVIAFAVNRWGKNFAITRDANIRNALLGGIDLALSSAQAEVGRYIGDKTIDLNVKSKILGIAGSLALNNYPSYSKFLKVDRKKIDAILQRRWGEIEQAKLAGVAVPPADPSVGASNAAPGLPAPA